MGASADKMLADAKKAYAGAEKAASKYGIEIGNVIKRQEKLQKQLGRIERERRRLQRKEGAGEDLRAIRGRVLGVAGVGYGVARLVEQANEREEQAQYLRTVINAPDKDAAVGRALDFAREFSRRSVADDQKVIEIQYALHSASFDETAANAAVSRVHKLAKVTRGSAGEVGEVFATTINNMGEGMAGTIEQKMDRVANMLAKTQFKFQIRDFGQLGEGLKYTTSGAIAAKVPLEQTAAVIGQLNSAGLQGSGSSPRGRGTPQRVKSPEQPHRFIPARAGNTISWVAVFVVLAVHPRAGGEHDFLGRGVRGARGSSPRGRGTRPEHRRRAGAHRFIPARAGNTVRGLANA